MVAVLDLDTDKHFHIAKVMAINGTTTTLWYAATKGKVLKTAVWKFMYNSPSNWGQGFTYTKPNLLNSCLLYTSPSPRDAHESRMPSSA